MPEPLDESGLVDVLQRISYHQSDTDHDRMLSRGELCRALCAELGRMPSDSELNTAWNLLDADGDGVVSIEEWRKIAFEADTVTGSIRGLLQALLRIIPRAPAVKFFAPKQRRREPLELSFRGARAKLGLMAASSLAGTALFASHGRSLGEQEDQPATSTEPPWQLQRRLQLTLLCSSRCSAAF